MLLAIDLGNTTTVLGIFRVEDLPGGCELLAHFRVATAATRTADEHAILLDQLLRLRDLDRSSLDAAILSSVVPPALPPLLEMIRQRLGIEPRVVHPTDDLGMPIRYVDPAQVGADRIVNAVAAREAYGGPLIVLDFGTATTFCVVSAEGEYLGGAIAPGIRLAAEALFARTAKLPRVQIYRPERVVGVDTEESIRSGLFYGYAALVDGMVERIARELGQAVRVVATGGFARELAEVCDSIDEVDPLLTLKGLRLLHQRRP